MQVLDILENVDTSHPFLPLIDNERHNPRLLIISRYLGLLKADELAIAGICQNCYSDESLPEEVRGKNHRDHLSQHLWSCELKAFAHHWRCPVCAEFVPTPEISGDDDAEAEAQWEQYEEHCERCYGVLMSELGYSLTKDDEDQDEEEAAESDHEATFTTSDASISSRATS